MILKRVRVFYQEEVVLVKVEVEVDLGVEVVLGGVKVVRESIHDHVGERKVLEVF